MYRAQSGVVFDLKSHASVIGKEFSDKVAEKLRAQGITVDVLYAGKMNPEGKEGYGIHVYFNNEDAEKVNAAFAEALGVDLSKCEEPGPDMF